MEPDCPAPPLPNARRCQWHWLARQDIVVQEQSAEHRRLHPKIKPGKDYLARYPDWRWCSGCSWLVPLYYCSGSRCRACSRAAARASHVRRTYAIDPNEELALRRWQGNRCFICGRLARTRQLAVDHDHDSGQVRGLLCSDDKFGCNALLARVLGDLPAASRLLAYVERTPLQRMRDGDEPWVYL